MNRQQGPYSIASLLAVIVLAFIYAFLEDYPHAFTGSGQFDGIIGVVLGLFICSQPAANFLSMLYRSSGDDRGASSAQPRWIWPLLNVLAMCAGLITVFIGTMQFTQATLRR